MVGPLYQFLFYWSLYAFPVPPLILPLRNIIFFCILFYFSYWLFLLITTLFYHFFQRLRQKSLSYYSLICNINNLSHMLTFTHVHTDTYILLNTCFLLILFPCHHLITVSLWGLSVMVLLTCFFFYHIACDFF